MLYVDRRPDAARVPGLHVLIIGVSRYRHLPGGGDAPTTHAGLDGLGQLPTTASTAFALARWLRERAEKNDVTWEVPLHTVRLLLSPTSEEVARYPDLAAAVSPAGYDAIRQAAQQWREDARRHHGCITLFYFCGHGVAGMLEDVLLLPEDFGDPAAPLLNRAISFTDVMEGMRPPFSPLEAIGRRQAYFVDACRNRPLAFTGGAVLDVPDLWPSYPPAEAKDHRERAVLYATLPGQLAFAGNPGEYTVFGQAVLDCLQGAAVEVEEEPTQPMRWRVGTGDLMQYLPDRIAERTKLLQVVQDFRTGDLMPFPLFYFNEPPLVEVEFMVAPPERGPEIGMTLTRLDPPPLIVRPIHPHPYTQLLPMDAYRIETVGKPIRCLLRPPRQRITVRGEA